VGKNTLAGSGFKPALARKPKIGRVTDPSQQGNQFLTATFTDPEQLTRFAETLPALGFTMPVAALKSGGWTLERPEVLALMAKLRQAGKPLGEYVGGEIYYGIKTGLNEAFVIDAATRERLIAEDPKSAEVIKPWLRGKDIFKWRTQWARLYVLALVSSANQPWRWANESDENVARSVFESEYPAIYRHMSLWEEKLKKRDDQGRHWWELRSCAYYNEFEKSKILWPGISSALSVFSLDESGYYGNDNNQFVLSGSQYLLAILNSPATSFVLGHVCDKVQGGFYRLKIIYIEQLPIPAASDEQQRDIVTLVKQILAAKAADPQADTSALEGEVDTLVYRLYDLIPEEIAIVEQGASKGGG